MLASLLGGSHPDPLLDVVQTALASGRPQLHDCRALAHEQAKGPLGGRDLDGAFGIRQVVVAPLIAGRRPLGVMNLATADAARELGHEDLPLLAELAGAAAQALERSRLYQQTQQAVRARDTVLAIVSHDLRNPLNALTLTARVLEQQLLRRGGPGGTQVQVILRAASRMEGLIATLGDAASIEAGQLKVELRPEETRTLLEEARGQLAPQVQAASLGFRVDLAPSQPAVSCDRQRIFQVIANLVDNAIKFTSPGGEIRLAARADGDGGIRVSVTDTGCGISHAALPHVFERYWRGESGRRHPGSGLGLFIAREIVHAHGGRIWTESEVGRGTTFSFTLPLAPRGQPGPATSAGRGRA
jgi:signal transduction histidine kinase